MVYVRGKLRPKEESDGEGFWSRVKGFFSRGDDEDEEPTALKVFRSFVDEEHVREFDGLPDSLEEAEKELETTVLRPAPQYKRKAHRTNGFDADRDSMYWHVARNAALGAIKDDFEGSISISIQREPVGSQHRTVIIYPTFRHSPKEGPVYDGIEVYEGKPRDRKVEMVIDLADFVDRVLPDVETT